MGGRASCSCQDQFTQEDNGSRMVFSDDLASVGGNRNEDSFGSWYMLHQAEKPGSLKTRGEDPPRRGFHREETADDGGVCCAALSGPLPPPKASLQWHYLSSAYSRGFNMEVEGTGYTIGVTDMQVQVYKHQASGVRVWCQALTLGPEGDESCDCVLFHYTSEPVFHAMTTSAKIGPELWASLKRETSLGGQGVYASGQEPEELAERASQELPDGVAVAPYCLPLMVPRAIAYDVCPAGPRFQNCDMWVIHCDGEASEAAALENVAAGMQRRFRCILQARQAHLGIDHTDTLDSFSYLAYLLDAHGQCAEAEGLYRKALRGYTDVLGSEHPDTLRTMNNLAVLLYAQGKIEEAEPLSRSYLNGCEARLGPDHVDTLASMNNHACLLQAQGRLDDAVDLFRAILERQQASLGSEHPKTFATAVKYALFLRSCGRLPEAEQSCRGMFEKCEAKLGIGHSLTLQGASTLAGFLTAQGRPREAEPLLRRVCTEREARLGVDHPTTLRSQCGLAGALVASGQHEEAESLYRQVLQARRRRLGTDQEDTLECLDGLTDALRAQGKLGEAEASCRQLLQLRHAKAGPEAVETCSCKDKLAAILHEQWAVTARAHGPKVELPPIEEPPEICEQPRVAMLVEGNVDVEMVAAAAPDVRPPLAEALPSQSLPRRAPRAERRAPTSCWASLAVRICGKG